MDFLCAMEYGSEAADPNWSEKFQNVEVLDENDFEELVTWKDQVDQSDNGIVLQQEEGVQIEEVKMPVGCVNLTEGVQNHAGKGDSVVELTANEVEPMTQKEETRVEHMSPAVHEEAGLKCLAQGAQREEEPEKQEMQPEEQEVEEGEVTDDSSDEEVVVEDEVCGLDLPGQDSMQVCGLDSSGQNSIQVTSTQCYDSRDDCTSKHVHNNGKSSRDACSRQLPTEHHRSHDLEVTIRSHHVSRSQRHSSSSLSHDRSPHPHHHRSHDRSHPHGSCDRSAHRSHHHSRSHDSSHHTTTHRYSGSRGHSHLPTRPHSHSHYSRRQGLSKERSR